MEQPMNLNLLYTAPAHTPSPLREVYDRVAEAVRVACTLRKDMINSRHDMPLFIPAACALATARNAANDALQDREIWLRTNAASVWEACRAALEAIEPVNHACSHVLVSSGASACDHLGGDFVPCPPSGWCRDWGGDTRAYFAAVPTVDERAILESMRRETIAATRVALRGDSATGAASPQSSESQPRAADNSDSAETSPPAAQADEMPKQTVR